MPATIRPYAPGDETGWLHCRLLSFFGTSYFDDVHLLKTRFDRAVELVAVDDEDRVVALLDVEVEVEGDAATIDCVAVLPDAQGAGIASALLDAALARLPPEVRTLDAWTREDVAANRWYAARGFAIAHRYLHVYVEDGDPLDGFITPPGLSRPVKAFLHADIEHEADLRARFTRVHECRQYVRRLAAE
jgi:ribosomal protein S18 acetylase RimI-like enzyme